MRRRLMMQNGNLGTFEYPSIVGYETFTYVKGTTWREWINTKYNTGATRVGDKVPWTYGEIVGSGESAGQSLGYAIIISKSSDSSFSSGSDTSYNYYYDKYTCLALNGERVNPESEIITAQYGYVVEKLLWKKEARSSGGGGNVCLITGDKVLLSDGTYKNVEDITYDDLLMSYDFTTGNIVCNYPNLIIHYPKETRTNIRLCFENNTTLTLTTRHHLYDYNRNMFSTIDLPKDEFDFSLKDFVGAYYSNGKIIPLKLSSFEIFEEEVFAYDIQVAGSEVIFAEGLVSGTDVMNYLPKQDFMLYDQELCNLLKTAISNERFCENEYEWYKTNVTDKYPYSMWKSSLECYFHWSVDNSGLDEEAKKLAYLKEKAWIEKTMELVLPKDDDNVIVNINNEFISNVKKGTKVTLPDKYKKYYNISTYLYCDSGDEIEILTNTFIKKIY